MSSVMRQYLLDAYESRHSIALFRRAVKDIPIQIDDQDDGDKLNEFCNIFCIIGKGNNFRIELLGNFPITQEIADLAEIYNGFVDPNQGRLTMNLDLDKIEVLMDLADKIRKTSFDGGNVGNPNWLPISARTISSLYRFVRILKEFKHNRKLMHAV